MFIIVLWNIFTFLTYGIDKHCAKKTLWRIPEKILLAEALFLGAFGAFSFLIFIFENFDII